MRFHFDKPRPKKIATGPVIKRLLVRCETTAKLVSTGETIAEEAWAGAKLKPAKLVCPHCQKVHHWTKKDVLLAR